MLLLKDKKKPVRAVAFSLDGRILATGSPKCAVKLWDLATGQERAALRDHAEWDPKYELTGARILAFLPDGRLLSHTFNWVRVWDPDSAQPVATR